MGVSQDRPEVLPAIPQNYPFSL
ncbi:hypothetical protein RA210_U10659 [Rubrivivax sp. A210]|nr:hypothetical protein RA210_U10659 [Rubrivivax sp. A210]